MNTYQIRIAFTGRGKPQPRKAIKASNFKQACERAAKRYKTWIKHGHDVQVYNPGEVVQHLNQSQWISH